MTIGEMIQTNDEIKKIIINDFWTKKTIYKGSRKDYEEVKEQYNDQYVDSWTFSMGKLEVNIEG